MKMEHDSDPEFIVRYRGNTYNITDFVHKHPGGIDTLKGLTNTDMTKRFQKAPPHSDAAMYLLNEYKIEDKDNNLSGFEHNQNTDDRDNNNYKADLDESMEHLVDWSKPMLAQIPAISKYYNEWVHKPVDRPLRLFGPWYLEMLTKTPWWVVPLFWIPIISYVLYSETFSEANISLKSTSILLYVIEGIVTWTFIEYSLHRWVFHVEITSEQSKKLCLFHFLIHGLHHKVPFDSMRLVFPPFPAVIIATILYMPVLAIFTYPRIVMSGGLIGYLFYDLMHYYLHFGNPKFRHMYQMKRYHYQHHFGQQDIGFGITSPLWDIVFRTQIYLRKLKFMIRW